MDLKMEYREFPPLAPSPQARLEVGVSFQDSHLLLLLPV